MRQAQSPQQPKKASTGTLATVFAVLALATPSLLASLLAALTGHFAYRNGAGERGAFARIVGIVTLVAKALSYALVSFVVSAAAASIAANVGVSLQEYMVSLVSQSATSESPASELSGTWTYARLGESAAEGRSTYASQTGREYEIDLTVPSAAAKSSITALDDEKSRWMASFSDACMNGSQPLLGDVIVLKRQANVTRLVVDMIDKEKGIYYVTGHGPTFNISSLYESYSDKQDALELAGKLYQGASLSLSDDGYMELSLSDMTGQPLKGTWEGVGDGSARRFSLSQGRSIALAAGADELPEVLEGAFTVNGTELSLTLCDPEDPSKTQVLVFGRGTRDASAAGSSGSSAGDSGSE